MRRAEKRGAIVAMDAFIIRVHSAEAPGTFAPKK
jgi:hypothetical protein